MLQLVNVGQKSLVDYATIATRGLMEEIRRLAEPLAGTVQGDRHEGGVLMIGLLLELAGWRALALGVDLPVRELYLVMMSFAFSVMMMSFRWFGRLP